MKRVILRKELVRIEKMENFVIKLKKDLQCSLCKETLIEPKILPCFHTFCKLCIKRHAQLIEKVNVFKCPECKLETSLPELSSVKDLKPSLIHSRMIKVLEFVESEKVCSVSESHSPASWYCFDCNRSLCDECEKNHSLFTKDHQTHLNNLKKEDLELMLKKENICQDHQTNIYEFYCKDCNEYICVKCIRIRKCGGHNTMNLREHTSLKRTILKEIFDQLKVKHKEIEKQVETLKEITFTTNENGERAKAEVKETINRLVAAFRESEQKLVREIEQKVEKADENLLKGQLVVNQTQSVLDYVAKVMENGIVSEIETTVKGVEGYSKYVDNPNRQESRFEFVCTREVNAIKNSDIGTLKPMLTDHEKSLIQVQPADKLEALRKARLILITKTSKGNLNDDRGDVVDVEIFPEDDVKLEEKKVRNDGKIEREFTAKVPGQLTAVVKVNGKHVSNSPLVMDVKPQHMRVTNHFKMKGIKEKSTDFTGIALSKDNNRIAVANKSSHCVHIFNIDGDLLQTIGSRGKELGQLSSPHGLAFLNEIDLVIADYDNDRICIANTTTGKLVRSFGKRGQGTGQFKYPCGVHVDDDGSNIIVSDYHNHRIQVFTRDGEYRYHDLLQGDPVSTVTYGALFYVVDDNTCSIHVFKKKNRVFSKILTFGKRGSADGQLSKPSGLAINNDHLLVCDRGNNRIQKFTLDGRFVGKMDISQPCYIAVLKSGDSLVTADQGVVCFTDQ